MISSASVLSAWFVHVQNTSTDTCFASLVWLHVGKIKLEAGVLTWCYLMSLLLSSGTSGSITEFS